MKKIFITGGTGAIGNALVAEFIKNPDYEVWFSYHNNKSKADEIAAKFNARSIQIKDNDVSKVPGDFDILVNNAGIIIFDDITETVSDDNMRDTLEVNLMLPFRLSKLVLPHMKNKKWGRIINISSTNSIRPETETISYNVSKSALNTMTKTIAKEYAKFGITCNAVAPSLVADAGTGMESAKYYGEDIKTYMEFNPTSRLAKAADVATVCAFLASDNASFINGVILPVDGGQTA